MVRSAELTSAVRLSAAHSSQLTARRPTPSTSLGELLRGHVMPVRRSTSLPLYAETGWTGGGLEAPGQIGHISFASVCSPSLAMTYLSCQIAFGRRHSV